MQQQGQPCGLLAALAALLPPERVADLQRLAATPGPWSASSSSAASGHAPAPAPPSGRSAVPGPGDRVGPYVVVKELGRGGMGAVYVADHAEVGHRVALKV